MSHSAETSADDATPAEWPCGDSLGWDKVKRRKERSRFLSYLPALAPEEFSCVLDDLLV